MTKKQAPVFHTQRYVLTGVLTVIPLWITWLVFEFFLQQLSAIGRPWVRALAKATQKYLPSVSEILVAPWFESG
mgnify:CR=1 FL=1